MSQDDERRKAFEARLQELKKKMEAGLVGRAQTLRDAAARLASGDEEARRTIKHESHKLRGIAGSYGYQELTDLAGEVEQRASLSPPPMLEQLARDLAGAAEDVGRRSESTQHEGKPSTSSPLVPPMPSSSKRRGASLRPQVQGGDGGPLRVLAMDDDPTTLRLLRLTLKDIGGFDAVIVTSAQQALAEMLNREFDVVISDAMMPDMNGKEFCEAARKQGGWAARVPIVILSAATPDELGWSSDITKTIEWLRKPFMPSALVKDVARVVTNHTKRLNSKRP